MFLIHRSVFFKLEEKGSSWFGHISGGKKQMEAAITMRKRQWGSGVNNAIKCVCLEYVNEVAVETINGVLDNDFVEKSRGGKGEEEEGGEDVS